MVGRSENEENFKLKVKAKVEKLQSKLISGTEIDSMKERKIFFNGIKAHQDSAESVLEVIFQYLYPNSSEDLVTLIQNLARLSKVNFKFYMEWLFQSARRT